MTAATLAPAAVHARRVGFFGDVVSVARRALRLIPRDLEGVIPALIVPVFFFAVNIGSLQNLTEAAAPGFDFKAFQLPVAIIFAVTGISRASTLVIDIQDGYFDRLLMTPMSRRALLLGLMVSDFVLVLALSIPVLLLGFVVGVRFDTGFAGIVAFLLMAAAWGIAFTGFPYAIALKTGSPAAVNSSFLLFFPFAFLTTAFVPEEAMTGWLATIATYNPVTYLLEALRSLIMVGWDASALFGGVLAIVGVGLVSQTLAFMALRGRVKRG
jgi:ABC-2 type transport system permease protein